MTNILDTVEPDGFMFTVKTGGPKPKAITFAAIEYRIAEGEELIAKDGLYSRSTLEPAIERLLAEHRKQVLLAAAEVAESGAVPSQIDYLQGYHDGCMDTSDELRRMAEGEK